MIVLPDADLEHGCRRSCERGFRLCGRALHGDLGRGGGRARCRRADRRIADRLATLKVGDGLRGTDMGPLVTGAHRDKVAAYLQAGLAEGARLVVDGRTTRWMANPGASGWVRHCSTM